MIKVKILSSTKKISSRIVRRKSNYGLQIQYNLNKHTDIDQSLPRKTAAKKYQSKVKMTVQVELHEYCEYTDAWRDNIQWYNPVSESESILFYIISLSVES